eukprot:PhF_6_TR35997/c0_g1_i2/m.52145
MDITSLHVTASMAFQPVEMPPLSPKSTAPALRKNSLTLNRKFSFERTTTTSPQHSTSKPYAPRHTRVYIQCAVMRLQAIATLNKKIKQLRMTCVWLVVASILAASSTLLTTKDSPLWLDYALFIILTTSITISEICIYFQFRFKLKRRLLTDIGLSLSNQLWNSQYRNPWLIQSFLFLVHCPPVVARYYRPAQYLNFVVYLQLFFVSSSIMKVSSPLHRFVGKMLTHLAFVRNNISFFLRAMLFWHPFASLLVLYMFCFLLLSWFLSFAEKWPFHTAMWCQFTTSTTVGYGDFYPHTYAGRTLAALMSISGAICVSLF